MQKNKNQTTRLAMTPQANASQATLTLIVASDAGLGVGRSTSLTTFGEVRNGQWSVKLSSPYGLGILARMMRIEQLTVLVGADARARLDVSQPEPSAGQLRALGFTADEVEFLELFATGLKRPTRVTA